MPNEKGMTTPLSDKDFLLSMVMDSKGRVNLKSLKTALKHYPHLEKYVEMLPTD